MIRHTGNLVRAPEVHRPLGEQHPALADEILLVQRPDSDVRLVPPLPEQETPALAAEAARDGGRGVEPLERGRGGDGDGGGGDVVEAAEEGACVFAALFALACRYLAGDQFLSMDEK